MKQRIYQLTKTFRCSNQLAEAIDEFARHSNRHASDFIRDAVVFYIRQIEADPAILTELR